MASRDAGSLVSPPSKAPQRVTVGFTGQYDYMFKLLLTGDSGVGKSRFATISRSLRQHLRFISPPSALCSSHAAFDCSILLRFIEDEFKIEETATIGETARSAPQRPNALT